MKFSLFLLIFLVSSKSTVFSSIVVVNGLTHLHAGTGGGTISGRIQLRNDGTKDERFIVYQQDLLLSCSQNPDYKIVGSHNRSLGMWLKTNVDERVLKPDESYEITYTISIPKDVTEMGTYWDIIMVEAGEPVSETNTQGLTIQSKVRYGIQVISDIGVVESPKLIFEKIDFKKAEKEGEPKTIQIKLRNEGIFLAMSKINLEIFDSVGEKIKVINGFQKKVYPGYCNDFDIELKDLPKGKYDGILVADNGKDLFGENVTIEID